jgi:ribonuclease P protein component
MPRSYSFCGKKNFDRLFKIGRRRSSKNFSLVYSPSDAFKFATIVPKKNVKKASSRNYSKRIMREIIRKEILPTHSQHLFIFAFICKTDLKTLKTTDPDLYNHMRDELLFLTKSI